MNLLKILFGKKGKVNVGSVLTVASGAAVLILGGSVFDTAQRPEVAPERLTYTGNAFTATQEEARLHYGGSDYVGRGNVRTFRDTRGDGTSDVVDDWSGQVADAVRNAGYGTQDNVGFGSQGVDDTGKSGLLATDTSNPVDPNAVRGAVNSAGGYGNGGPGVGGMGGAGGVGGAGVASGAGGTLSNASITHPSGGSNGGGSTYSPGVNGGNTGGGRNGTGGNGANPKEGYQLSGSMPGSNPSFASNNTRAQFGSSAGRSSSRRGGNELADIARMSKQLVSQSDKPANAMNIPYQVGDTRYRGYKVAEKTDEPNLAPLVPAEVKPNLDGTEEWKNENQAYAKKLAKARKALAIRLLVMLGVGVALGITMYFLLKAGKNMLSNPLTAATGAALLTAGFAILLSYIAYTLGEIGDCLAFLLKWKPNAGSLPITGMLLCLSAALAMKSVAAKALSGGLSAAEGVNPSGFVSGMANFSTALSGGIGGAVTGVVSSTGIGGVKDVISAINNPDAK